MRQNTNGEAIAAQCCTEVIQERAGKEMSIEESSVRGRGRYLAVGMLGMLFAGVIYAWSILKVPMAEAFGWSGSPLALNYTITMCFFCIGSLLGGIFVKRVSVRRLLMISAVLMLAGFMIVSFLNGSSYLPLYISYGVMAGLGIGIAYNTLLSTASAWYPDKKGTCSGALMMFFGLSTLVLGQAASRLFALPAVGWRMTFRILAVVIFAVFAFCAVTMKRPAPGTKLPKAAAKGNSAEDFETRDYDTAEVIRRPAFWIFYVYGTLGAAVGSVVISFARELALSLGAQLALATLLVGILSVFNGVGRVLCGITFDKLGRKTTMLIVSIITVIAPAVMLLAIARNSLILGIIAFCITGISYSCYPTISSAFIATFYGTKDFPMNYSISNTKMLFSSFAATAASSLLVSTGSYYAPFMMLLVFSGISLGLLFLIRRP